MHSINARIYAVGSDVPRFVPYALLTNPVTVYNTKFNVRREDAGFIIGSKGFKVKRFMRDTGAHIEIAHTEQESFFYIQALTYQAVHTAVTLIEAEARKAFDLNTGRKQKTQTKQYYQLTVPVVSATAGLLIGRGGATCRGIKHKLGIAGLRVDTVDGATTVRISGNDHNHCQRVLAQLQMDFPTVFFTAPPAPRKMAPSRSSPPARPPPLNFNVGGGAVAPEVPTSPIDGYLPGGADGPRTPDGPPPPRTPDGPPPRTPDESPPASSWKGIPEEQIRQECMMADRMLHFFTKNN